MIGLALWALPLVVLYLYVEEPLVNRSRDGPTAPIAASELQRVVKEVQAGANVDARSERVLLPTDLAELQEVPVELTVAGSTATPWHYSTSSGEPAGCSPPRT